MEPLSIAYDIAIWIGSDFESQFEVLNDEDGSPVNITGSTIQFRVLDGEGTELFAWESDDDHIAVDDAASGTFTLTIPNSETRLIPLDRVATYECELRTGSAQSPLFHGFLNGQGGKNND